MMSTRAVFTAESSRKPKTMLTAQPAIWPSGRPERAADEDLRHVAQHVVAHALRAGGVHVGAIGRLHDLQIAAARAWRGRAAR